MAYVPGNRYDLFMSYARKELPWVEVFKECLTNEFESKTAKRLCIWIDTKLQPGDVWRAKTDDAIRNAAAFLAVDSPLYRRSPECKQEFQMAYQLNVERSLGPKRYPLLKAVRTIGFGVDQTEM